MGFGRLLMGIGLGLFFLGLTLSYAPWLFTWFGRLPGDLRFEGDGRQLFIPITSMILISLGLTLILNLFFRR